VSDRVSEVVSILRGELNNCQCGVYGSCECGCDAQWPEYAADEAATLLELLATQRDDLLAAAKAVVERWDTPSWKDTGPTAEVIGQLRREIARAEAGKGGEG
jgi:hypothetical protein